MQLQYPLETPPARITSRFGKRAPMEAGGFITSPSHGGVDFAPPKAGQVGFPARAVGPGRVVAIRDARGTRNEWGNVPVYNAAAGNYVITEHRAATGTYFVDAWGIRHTRIWIGRCHLASVDCELGDYLNTGDADSITGDTGAAKGEHVHTDCFVDLPALGTVAFNRRIDPLLVLGPWRSKDSAPTTPDTPAVPAAPTAEEGLTMTDIATLQQGIDAVRGMLQQDSLPLTMTERDGKHLVCAPGGVFRVVQSAEHREILTRGLTSLGFHDPRYPAGGPGKTALELIDAYVVESLAEARRRVDAALEQR